MTPAEYDILVEEIAVAADKLLDYDSLQDDIDRMTNAKGTVTQVNFITGVGNIAVSDADMISKAEAALVKLITAREAEQDAI